MEPDKSHDVIFKPVNRYIIFRCWFCKIACTISNKVLYPKEEKYLYSAVSIELYAYTLVQQCEIIQTRWGQLLSFINFCKGSLESYFVILLYAQRIVKYSLGMFID